MSAPQAAGVIRARRFELVDRHGLARAQLAVDHEGAASLEVLDGQEHLRARLTVTESGGAGLTLYGGNHRERVTVMTDMMGKPLAGMCNEKGEAMFGAPDG